MQKVINFLLVLTIVLSATASLAKTKEATNDKKIYDMIQQAYIKESNIYYQFRYALTKINSKEDLTSVVSRHKKNISLLEKVMDEYNIAIPKVNKTPAITINNTKQVCQHGLLLEKELSTFYNDSIRTLSTMVKNETIGLLTETFETLRDNSFSENSLIFRRCSH